MPSVITLTGATGAGKSLVVRFFREAESTVSFGRPAARGARRDAFSIFLSKPALDRLVAHDWPGNHRELRLFAVNALVFTLVHHLDAQAAATDDPNPGSARRT